jgi:hypothetical protein
MIAWLAATGLAWADGKTRLFILSGQSNMAGLNPDLSFTPTVKKAFAGDEVIVVKHAVGGQPIRRWYKAWKAPAGTKVKNADKPGDLFDVLMKQVAKASKGKNIDSVVFVWMQGERDAKEKLDEVYEASLRGLIDQVEKDLNRKDVHVVIGRLSDHLKGDPAWDAVRAAQVKVAESNPRFGWVDTDDLNGPGNGLHYTKEGYVELGKRFADRSIELINRKK